MVYFNFNDPASSVAFAVVNFHHYAFFFLFIVIFFVLWLIKLAYQFVFYQNFLEMIYFNNNNIKKFNILKIYKDFYIFNILNFLILLLSVFFFKILFLFKFFFFFFSFFFILELVFFWLEELWYYYDGFEEDIFFFFFGNWTFIMYFSTFLFLYLFYYVFFYFFIFFIFDISFIFNFFNFKNFLNLVRVKIYFLYHQFFFPLKSFLTKYIYNNYKNFFFFDFYNLSNNNLFYYFSNQFIFFKTINNFLFFLNYSSLTVYFKYLEYLYKVEYFYTLKKNVLTFKNIYNYNNVNFLFLNSSKKVKFFNILEINYLFIFLKVFKSYTNYLISLNLKEFLAFKKKFSFLKKNQNFFYFPFFNNKFYVLNFGTRNKKTNLNFNYFFDFKNKKFEDFELESKSLIGKKVKLNKGKAKYKLIWPNFNYILFFDFIYYFNFIKQSIFFTFFFFKDFKHSHNLEWVGTIIPAIILIFILWPSLVILYFFDRPHLTIPYITIHVVAHQWYWSYEYTDYNFSIIGENALIDNQQKVNFDSYIIQTDDLKEGMFRLFETDNRLLLPTGLCIRIVVSSADVLHSWAVPSLGIKVDAVPGRLNQFWLVLERPGIFFGQCSELCGVDHSYMPILVEVTSYPNYTIFCENFLETN